MYQKKVRKKSFASRLREEKKIGNIGNIFFRFGINQNFAIFGSSVDNFGRRYEKKVQLHV